jgi:hypothetical protein
VLLDMDIAISVYQETLVAAESNARHPSVNGR